jgi:imidazolonepropionase-like amidohydrolase
MHRHQLQLAGVLFAGLVSSSFAIQGSQAELHPAPHASWTTGTPVSPQGTAGAAEAPTAGAKGGAGLALRTVKALVASWEGEQVVDDAIVLVKDGKILAVGPASSTEIPVGFEVLDVGEYWLMPGMIDLHSHVGGSFDINDMVYLTQPELRVSASVVPRNPNLARALASGVTTILYIPGSGVNIGGQGILLKTGLKDFEEARIRDPGSLKLAQWGNPEGWTIGIGMAFENWNTRNTFARGMAYAKAWKDADEGKGPRPERNLQWDVFRKLLAKETQVSTHTQVYQVVLMTITMIRMHFGLDVYIDHGEFQGFRAAELAQREGVPAIIGPREIDRTWRGFVNMDLDGKIVGIAAEYQKRGHKQIGFNTDANVIPAEELFLQSAMAVRYGFDDSNMENVRGLTIVPAKTAGIADRVGSLEAGKDADILVISGDPSDPRSHVETIFINGKRVYDTATEPRRF